MSNTPQPGSPALASFALQLGPRAGEELPVRSAVASIGQGAQNDVVLDDDTVSKTHARLEYDPAGWRLTDLASTNGTWLDGVRLAPEVPTPLAYGAEVRFGAVRLRFQPVETADLEGARARYTPPPPAVTLADRKRPFRFPVWAFVLLLILLGIVIFFVLNRPEPAVTLELRRAVQQVALASAYPPPS